MGFGGSIFYTWKYCKDPFISRYRFAGFYPTSLKGLYLTSFKTKE